MLLADPNYSLYDYKAGCAIPYPFIRGTRKAAESSSFQIRTYHAFLWQAENGNKICFLPFFLGVELCTCHQSNHEQ